MLCFVGMTSVAADTVKLAYVNSSTEIASTNVIKVVLEDMGYDVNIIRVDANTMFQKVADGTADGMVAAWLPGTHEEYFNALKNQLDDLGPNLNGTKTGLVVPSYVTVDSVEDLKDSAEQFGGKVIGIEPDSELMLTTNAVMQAYGLSADNKFQLIEGNEETMIAALEAAINNNQWIVVTGWQPHWKFSRWPLKFLNDPRNLYESDGYIGTVVRQGLKEDMPDVYNVLDKFNWTAADMEQVMAWNAETGTDPYLNAKRWVRMNQDKVITNQARFGYLQGPTYDMDTGRLYIPSVEIIKDGKRVSVYKAELQVTDTQAPMLFALQYPELVWLEYAPIGYGTIVKRVYDRGKLLCGVRSDLSQKGFAYLDEQGRYAGFDIDLCRAVAAAVFDNPEAVEFVQLVAEERGQALQSGKVDMLSRQTTWTSTRDAQWGDFTWIMFYDGQGFMVRADSNLTTLEQLDGKNICVVSGTTTELNLEERFSQLGFIYTLSAFTNTPDAFKAYEDGVCTVITTDQSNLAVKRNGFSDPKAHTILDATISKEPLAPVVPHGDSQWLDLVKTVMMALINAEELGITQANVDDMVINSNNPAVRRLLGGEESFGQSDLGLEADAIAQAIRAVGNYGEIYERSLGENGIGLQRSLNLLWTQRGGMLYAPPLR